MSEARPARTVDVLVVGAGPAGLFAALGVARTTGLSVEVIDAGQGIEDRRRRTSGTDDPQRAAALVQGIGGAGLFSDGKLCLSLRVGGNLPSLLSRGHRQRLLETVAAMLGVTEHVTEPERDVVPLGVVAAGRLEFTHYDVLHIGTEFCADRILDLVDALTVSGVMVRARTRLVAIERRPDGCFDATVEQDGGPSVVRARAVVLAMGKVGAHLQAQLSRSLGARVVAQPMYVGVRIDTPVGNASGLFRGTDDPKYKLHFDDGSKIKTHCAAQGGEILPLYYEGLPLAGGHAYKGRRSGRTSFGALWDGIRDGADGYETARQIMSRTHELTDGRLLAQRLVDYLAGRPSTDADVREAGPSSSFWKAGDIGAVLPDGYHARFVAFVSALGTYAPELVDDSTVLFAPAIEWWMSKIATDEHLQSAVPGLYVAGDGGGWSQGIVHAAATGLVVAEGISGMPVDVRRIAGAAYAVT